MYLDRLDLASSFVMQELASRAVLTEHLVMVVFASNCFESR